MFTTKVKTTKAKKELDYRSNIMTMGSCFSENLGEKMTDAYFSVLKNPFGVLYNPISIKNSLYSLLKEKHFQQADLFFDGSLWHSFAHSSQFSNQSAEKTVKNINKRLEFAVDFLKKTDLLIISLGTAWVYKHIKSDCTVSNCHKIPAKEFKRYRLTAEDILLDYTELINELNKRFPKLEILFTVSPIRHWKDGAHENNISKGILHLSIDALELQFDNVSYFPAYEILLDELRDYRYYANDMLHPSDIAIDYIWERFSENYFSKNTLEEKKELLQLRADLSHRPLHPDSETYRKFQEHTNKRKKALMEKYPFLKNRLHTASIEE